MERYRCVKSLVALCRGALHEVVVVERLFESGKVMHVMHFYSFKYEKRENSPLGIETVILMMIVESPSCVTESTGCESSISERVRRENASRFRKM